MKTSMPRCDKDIQLDRNRYVTFKNFQLPPLPPPPFFAHFLTEQKLRHTKNVLQKNFYKQGPFDWGLYAAGAKPFPPKSVTRNFNWKIKKFSRSSSGTFAARILATWKMWHTCFCVFGGRVLCGEKFWSQIFFVTEGCALCAHGVAIPTDCLLTTALLPRYLENCSSCWSPKRKRSSRKHDFTRSRTSDKPQHFLITLLRDLEKTVRVQCLRGLVQTSITYFF